jgi:hypothetical protein
MPEMGRQLIGLSRCPHCSVASPLLSRVWASKEGEGTPQELNGYPKAWATYLCSTCGGGVLAEGNTAYHDDHAARIFPQPSEAHEDIPPVARRFLQQAFETLHAPDAAAVMAGSAVDAMLKEKGLVDGSLYKRIDEALKGNILTQGMADWAHSVRLGSNRPRHADTENPHVSHAEARQSVEFAEALGNFLFVLAAKIERGIAASKQS